jgi:hypothetical protein
MRDREDQTVGEVEPGVLAVLRDGCLHGLGVLDHELLMVQEHLYPRRDLLGLDAIHHVQDAERAILHRGELVNERFTIDRLAEIGGMGRSIARSTTTAERRSRSRCCAGTGVSMSGASSSKPSS